MVAARTLMKPGRSRARKIDDILALLTSRGPLHPEPLRELLDAFGHSEWSRGFDDGVRDATGDD